MEKDLALKVYIKRVKKIEDQIEATMATKYSLKEVEMHVATKAEHKKQSVMEDKIEALEREIANLGINGGSVMKEFKKLDDEVKREFKTVRQEMRDQQALAADDSHFKMQKISESVNTARKLDQKIDESMAQVN